MIPIRRNYLLLSGSALLIVLLGVAAATLPRHPDATTVPTGTAIHVTLDQAIAGDQNRPGDHFEATVSEPVVINGKTVIPQGDYVEGPSLIRSIRQAQGEGTAAAHARNRQCERTEL